MSRIRTFLTQSPRRRRLALEAVFYLFRAWILVRVFSFQKYSSNLGHARPGEVQTEEGPDPDLLQDVRWAVDSVSKSCGGIFTCLMRGMAGKAMLNKRGVPNSLVLGAKLKSADDKPSDDSMAAHAWLWAGSRIILGGRERAGYLPVTSYFSD